MSTNPWLIHVRAFSQSHPNLSYKECLAQSRKSYTPLHPTRPKAAKKTKGGALNDNMAELKGALDASYAKGPAEKRRLLEQHGFELDEDLSGQRATVFTDKNGQPHIVYRGTDNIQDVGTDIGAYVGFKGKRIAHSKKVLNEVRDKYSAEPTVAGHSLAGWILENVGAKGDAITYNKLATGRTKGNKSQTDVRQTRDVASAIAAVIKPKKNKTITVKSKSWNPLTNHSTKGLKAKNILKKKK